MCTNAVFQDMVCAISHKTKEFVICFTIIIEDRMTTVTSNHDVTDIALSTGSVALIL
jgi:hypothetical protein